ncbi:hypothetical protein C8Q78DRAFT_732938 [Trametes maxima]|nr:hypothetical protein C8Q78DRAFT_732938 [Trametes maxima]
MRLLDTESGQFRTVSSHFEVPYAILSHTWDPEGEQSFQDVCEIQASVWKGGTTDTLLFWLCYVLQSTMIENSDTAKPTGRPTFTAMVQHFLLLRFLALVRRILSAPAFKDIRAKKSILSDRRLAAKIRRSCAIAREAGYRYVWIDSCCIDKTSSSELSEAINSMFVWYRHSSLCFAFMADVRDGEDPDAENSEFRRSRWFTRGWTLQELLAPLVVLFLNKEWKVIGTKGTLAQTISQVTRIPGPVLRHLKDMRASSVAQRMSWAALRVTTREEDEAYCLMGIFGVNMPTLYGEGCYAFIRLQQEILKLEFDQSIFAWSVYVFFDEDGDQQIPRMRHLNGPCPARPNADYGIYVGHQQMPGPLGMRVLDTMLIPATSPMDFMNCAGIAALSLQEFSERLGLHIPPPSYTPSPFGIRTRLPLIPFDGKFAPHSQGAVHLPGERQWYLAVVACENEAYETPGHLLAFICCLQVAPAQGESITTGSKPRVHIPVLAGGTYIEMENGRHNSVFRTVMLSPSDIAACRTSIHMLEVDIPMQPPRDAMTAAHQLRRVMTSHEIEFVGEDENFARAIPATIQLATWCQSLLREQGFIFAEMPEGRVPGDGTLPLRGFTVSKNGAEVAVQYKPRIDFDRQGASLQIRFPMPIAMFGQVLDLFRLWGPWQPLTEISPVVGIVGDSGGTLRLLNFTLKHHSRDVYLLGIEPLEWDHSEQIRTDAERVGDGIPNEHSDVLLFDDSDPNTWKDLPNQLSVH